MLETISILKVQPNAALIKKKESVTCVFSNTMIGYLQFTYLESYPPYKIGQGKAYSIVTKPVLSLKHVYKFLPIDVNHTWVTADRYLYRYS